MIKAVKIILAVLMGMVFGLACMLMLPLFLIYAAVKIITGMAAKV